MTDGVPAPGGAGDKAQEKRPRKVRRDKGIRLMNGRDRRILAWAAEQYALRFDHLQQLLSAEPGHHSDKFAPGRNGITDSAVDQVLDRWLQEPAWAEYRRFHVDTPGWVWPTPFAIDVLHGQGLVPKYGRHFLRESTLEHLHWINCVRLDYERRHPDFRWVSERTLRKILGRREEGDDLAHIPDGQLWVDDRRAAAVEVELSPKNSDAEYDAILDELLISGVMLPDGNTFTYRTVWYFVSSATPVHVQARRMVEAARERLEEEYRSRVMVIELEKMVQRNDTTTATAPGQPGQRA